MKDATIDRVAPEHRPPPNLVVMRFHDRHEWIDYLKACEVARRIVADPSMIADAQRFVATRMAPDPHQRDYA